MLRIRPIYSTFQNINQQTLRNQWPILTTKSSNNIKLRDPKANKLKARSHFLAL